MTSFTEQVLGELSQHLDRPAIADTATRSLTIAPTPVHIASPRKYPQLKLSSPRQSGQFSPGFLTPTPPAAVGTHNEGNETSEQTELAQYLQLHARPNSRFIASLEEQSSFRPSFDSFTTPMSLEFATQDRPPSSCGHLSVPPTSETSHASHEPLTRLRPETQLPPTRPKSTDSNWLVYTRLGRSCISRYPIYSIGLVVVTFVQSIVVVAILAYVWQVLRPHITPQDPRSGIIFAYLIIFIVAAALSFILVIDSLVSQNVIQLAALCVFNLLMTCYGVVLPIQMNHAFKVHSPGLQGYMLVVPAIMGVSTIFMVGLTVFCHKEFGWVIYKQMGASRQLRQAVQLRSIFSILQKFNSFFFLGTLIQYVVLDQPIGWRTACISIFVLAMCLFIMLSASIAIEREIRWPLWLSHAGSASFMAFMIYFLVKVIPQPEFYGGHRTLRFFSIVTVVNLAMVVAVSELCAQRFGIGMRKLRARTQWWSREDRRPSVIKRWAVKRMSID